MKKYHEYKDNDWNRSQPLPHILGLTASVVTQKCTVDKFVKLFKDLEDNTHCKVITTENLADIVR